MKTRLQKGDILKITKGGSMFNKIYYINDMKMSFIYCIQLKNDYKIDKRKNLKNGSQFSDQIHNCYFELSEIFYTAGQNGAYKDGFVIIKRNVSIDETM